MKRLLARLGLGFSLLLAGCGSQQEHIVDAAGGRRAPDVAIDRDSWGLFPAGALVWGQVDIQALSRAEFGPAILERAQRGVPLSRGAGIDWAKDVETAHFAVYASARGDVATVLKGRFDAQKLRAAITADPVTSSGEPISISKFAGAEVIHAGAWSLSILTSRTIAVGTEIGVRRILERVEEGRVARALPHWFEKMLQTAGGRAHLGVDLDAQPVPATIRSELDFLAGIRGARLIGNFESPGLNIAGTLSYDTKERAEHARSRIDSNVTSLERATWLLTILKVPRPIRRFESSVAGQTVQFATELEGRAVAMGVGYLGELEGKIGLE